MLWEGGHPGSSETPYQIQNSALPINYLIILSHPNSPLETYHQRQIRECQTGKNPGPSSSFYKAQAEAQRVKPSSPGHSAVQPRAGQAGKLSQGPWGRQRLLRSKECRYYIFVILYRKQKYSCPSVLKGGCFQDP